MNSGVLIGFGLVLVATFTAALSDVITKVLAINSEPGLVLFSVGLFVSIFAILVNRLQKKPILSGGWRTTCPGLTLIRALLGVVSVACFFQAFASLPLVEVFVFIGFMPVIAAIISRPILGESVSRAGWISLLLGACGVMMLFPGGVWSFGWGHAMAFGGASFGAASLVLIRKISRFETNPFAQVIYPHVALAFVMLPVALAGDFDVVWIEVGLVLVLSVLVLVTRSLVVHAFAKLRAHVATMLMNVQFLWAFLFGVLVFSEFPEANVIAGACMIVTASLFLVGQQALCVSRSLTLRRYEVLTPGE